jgi:hypothetical protein
LLNGEHFEVAVEYIYQMARMQDELLLVLQALSAVCNVMRFGRRAVSICLLRELSRVLNLVLRVSSGAGNLAILCNQSRILKDIHEVGFFTSD